MGIIGSLSEGLDDAFDGKRLKANRVDEDVTNSFHVEQKLVSFLPCPVSLSLPTHPPTRPPARSCRPIQRSPFTGESFDFTARWHRLCALSAMTISSRSFVDINR